MPVRRARFHAEVKSTSARKEVAIRANRCSQGHVANLYRHPLDHHSSAQFALVASNPAFLARKIPEEGLEPSQDRSYWILSRDLPTFLLDYFALHQRRKVFSGNEMTNGRHRSSIVPTLSNMANVVPSLSPFKRLCGNEF